MAERAVPDASATPAEGHLIHAVVDGPLGAERPNGWQVGHGAPPTAPDPAVARAARLEARLAVYAQYAAAVAEEAAATVAGDEERRVALRAARGAAAEHFAELRETTAAEPAPTQASGLVTFADALTDALYELRHQDAVDDALARRLRALHDVAAVRDYMPALPADTSLPRLDVRF